MKNDRRVSGEVVPSGKQVTVWFVKQTGENLEVVPVSKSKLKSDNMTSAVEALLEGPDDQDRASGIGTEIPGGTILLGIKNEGDSVELNLSKRFASGGGPTSMETRLEQLAKTVKGVDSSKQLFVNVEGEPLTATSADGLEISQPIDILNH
jgi:spore germination protein GerM